MFGCVLQNAYEYLMLKNRNVCLNTHISLQSEHLCKTPEQF